MSQSMNETDDATPDPISPPEIESAGRRSRCAGRSMPGHQPGVKPGTGMSTRRFALVVLCGGLTLFLPAVLQRFVPATAVGGHTRVPDGHGIYQRTGRLAFRAVPHAKPHGAKNPFGMGAPAAPRRRERPTVIAAARSSRAILEVLGGAGAVVVGFGVANRNPKAGLLSGGLATAVHLCFGSI